MKKIESLQSLRTLAFIEVLLFHCHIKKFTGALGVSIFLILSGFLIQLKYKEKEISLKKNIYFSLKKISKMYNLHIITLICSLVFKKFKITIGILLNIFLLQSLSFDRKIWLSGNGVVWYLSTYMFILFLTPNICKYINKKSNIYIYIYEAVILIIMTIIGIVVSKYDYNIAHWITYVCPLYRIGDFTIGLCLGKILKNSNKDKNKIIKYSIIEVGIIILLIVSIWLYNSGIILTGLKNTVLFIPISTSLVYIFYNKKGIITNILTNKVTIFIGNISLYLYLIHQIIIKTLLFAEIKMNFFIPNILLFIATLIISIICSIMYIKIEDKIRSIKRQHSNVVINIL